MGLILMLSGLFFRPVPLPSWPTRRLTCGCRRPCCCNRKLIEACNPTMPNSTTPRHHDTTTPRLHCFVLLGVGVGCCCCCCCFVCLQAKRIVMAQSTFSWWAAFLGTATEIHYPLVGEWWGARPRHRWWPDEVFLTWALGRWGGPLTRRVVSSVPLPFSLSPLGVCLLGPRSPCNTAQNKTLLSLPFFFLAALLHLG